MARQPAAVAPLVFRGRPRRLSLSDAALAGHESGEIVLPEALAAHSPSAIVSLPVRRGRSRRASLRLRLDGTAPPGRHRAELRLAGKSFPVELDIAAAPRLRMEPGSPAFVGSPGAEVAVAIRLTNDGNVPVELPERSTAAIFDGAAPAAALVEACRCGSDDPMQTLGVWLGALRAGCSVIDLRIAEGGVTLPTGAERTITLATRLPDGLELGHDYYGLCNLGSIFCLIGVEVRETKGKS
ncbi:MAG TPA: hypothetical protein VFZ91_15220 [Allosphingosinicella sp.]